MTGLVLKFALTSILPKFPCSAFEINNARLRLVITLFIQKFCLGKCLQEIFLSAMREHNERESILTGEVRRIAMIASFWHAVIMNDWAVFVLENDGVQICGTASCDQ